MKNKMENFSFNSFFVMTRKNGRSGISLNFFSFLCIENDENLKSNFHPLYFCCLPSFSSFEASVNHFYDFFSNRLKFFLIKSINFHIFYASCDINRHWRKKKRTLKILRKDRSSMSYWFIFSEGCNCQ